MELRLKKSSPSGKSKYFIRITNDLIGQVPMPRTSNGTKNADQRFKSPLSWGNLGLNLILKGQALLTHNKGLPPL